MKYKKIIMIIILIALFIICLISVGTYFYIDYTKNNISEENISEENISEDQEIINSLSRVQNDSKEISKKHCLDNICIKDMTITNDYDEYYYITGLIYNDSNEVISKGLIKFIFNVSGKEISMLFYHDEIKANGSYDLEIHDDYEELVNADSYSIVKPSEAEEKEFYKNNLID